MLLKSIIYRFSFNLRFNSVKLYHPNKNLTPFIIISMQNCYYRHYYHHYYPLLLSFIIMCINKSKKRKFLHSKLIRKKILFFHQQKAIKIFIFHLLAVKFDELIKLLNLLNEKNIACKWVGGWYEKISCLMVRIDDVIFCEDYGFSSMNLGNIRYFFY